MRAKVRRNKMQTLQIMNDVSNPKFYIAAYKDEEAHQLAYDGTYCDAFNEALSVWGLDVDDVKLVVLDEMEHQHYFNHQNIDQENGFFHIEFTNGKSLQCCLIDGKGRKFQFNKAINSNDMGANEGLSSDCNEWFGSDSNIIDNVLLTAARKFGLKITND